MAALTERLETDYRTAMKAGQRLRVDTLRLIKAGVQRAAIDKQKALLEDHEVMQVLAQQAKQCQETIESAKRGGRDDILAQATQELSILKSYLPQPLSTEALSQLINEAVAAVGSNQGQIMKYVMGKASGAADGKLVNQLVSERLKNTSEEQKR